LGHAGAAEADARHLHGRRRGRTYRGAADRPRPRSGDAGRVIENGTLPSQKALYGRLSGLDWLVRQSDITGPALIVIGSVTALAEAATPVLESEPARAIAV